MSSELIEVWNIVKEVIKDVALYIMPIAAFVVSLIALKRSNDTMKVQIQVSEVEEKIKEYELALKKREVEKIQEEEKKEKRAYIEARIITVSSNKYRLKVWNSGDATAYNIVVSIPNEHGIIIMNRTMPFEYLNPGDNFDECVVVYADATSKFKVLSSWEDEQGKKYENEQLRSL